MLLAAQGTPHPSADLGQMVDTVCVDSRGKFTTGAWTPHHQSGHEGGLPALRVIDPIPALAKGTLHPPRRQNKNLRADVLGSMIPFLPRWSSVIQ
jgi:hypothetical protein